MLEHGAVEKEALDCLVETIHEGMDSFNPRPSSCSRAESTKGNAMVERREFLTYHLEAMSSLRVRVLDFAGLRCAETVEFQDMLRKDHSPAPHDVRAVQVDCGDDICHQKMPSFPDFTSSLINWISEKVY